MDENVTPPPAPEPSPAAQSQPPPLRQAPPPAFTQPIYGQPARGARPGAGWKIFAIVMALLFLLSITFNFLFGLVGGDSG
ncbi:MAG TPA: hypothetical protein VNT99_11115, partial [Methylomirabilota bacterium]|nr:hypothetical protein [Methylomirabilota bacterium]